MTQSQSHRLSHHVKLLPLCNSILLWIFRILAVQLALFSYYHKSKLLAYKQIQHISDTNKENGCLNIATMVEVSMLSRIYSHKLDSHMTITTTYNHRKIEKKITAQCGKKRGGKKKFSSCCIVERIAKSAPLPMLALSN